MTLVSLNEYFPTFRLTLRCPETSGTINPKTRRHKPEGRVLSWQSPKPCNPKDLHRVATNAKYMYWAQRIVTTAEEDVWRSGGNDQCILELGIRPIVLQFLRSGAKDGEVSTQSCSFRERPLICILGCRPLNWPAVGMWSMIKKVRQISQESSPLSARTMNSHYYTSSFCDPSAL